ncbi:MAG: hypothetical protein M1830_004281, partial [Pleopsidium flavum]
MPPKVAPHVLPPWRQHDHAGSAQAAPPAQPSIAPITTASTLFFQAPAPSLVPSEVAAAASAQPPSPWYPLPVDPFIGDDTPNASVVASPTSRDHISAARSEAERSPRDDEAGGVSLIPRQPNISATGHNPNPQHVGPRAALNPFSYG